MVMEHASLNELNEFDRSLRQTETEKTSRACTDSETVKEEKDSTNTQRAVDNNNLNACHRLSASLTSCGLSLVPHSLSKGLLQACSHIRRSCRSRGIGWDNGHPYGVLPSLQSEKFKTSKTGSSDPSIQEVFHDRERQIRKWESRREIKLLRLTIKRKILVDFWPSSLEEEEEERVVRFEDGVLHGNDGCTIASTVSASIGGSRGCIGAVRVDLELHVSIVLWI
ncbi:hypothetical protein Ancab_003280 [Ancistrocladus abbreviatus]